MTQRNSQPLTTPEAFESRMTTLFSENPFDRGCVLETKTFQEFKNLAKQEIRTSYSAGRKIQNGAELIRFAEEIFDLAIANPKADEHVLNHIGAKLYLVAGCLLDHCPVQDIIREEAKKYWERKRELTTPLPLVEGFESGGFVSFLSAIFR